MSTMSSEPVFRLRGIASGREAIAPVKEGVVYRDEETGEEMEPVARVLSAGPGGTARTPASLRTCRRCEQLTSRGLAECEFCGLPA